MPIDYNLGKECFEKHLKDMESKGINLELESLEKMVEERISLSASILYAIDELIKDKLKPKEVEFIVNAFEDNIDITRQATQLYFIKAMLYGKDDV